MPYLVAWMAALAALLALDREPAAGEGQSAHAFAFTSIEGEPLPMQAFADRPVLVWSTPPRFAASPTSTPPCNGFGKLTATAGSWSWACRRTTSAARSPGGAEEIKTFCEANFDVDFPLTEKVQVSGPGSHPLFAWLREELGAGVGPRWNFHKYLIAPDGGVAGAWPSAVEPDSAPITAAVEKLLLPPPPS